MDMNDTNLQCVGERCAYIFLRNQINVAGCRAIKWAKKFSYLEGGTRFTSRDQNIRDLHVETFDQ